MGTLKGQLMSNHVIVLSGPSGVGKGSVVREILANRDGFALSVSATTRAPRPGEVNGVDYIFLNQQEFEQRIATGQMLEHATVHGKHSYGTPRQPVLDQLAAGKSVILEIDIQGAKQVKANLPEAITVFIAPPNMEELARRLAGRGTESEAEQLVRLSTAEQEMAERNSFDFVVINQDVRETAAEVVKLASR